VSDGAYELVRLKNGAFSIRSRADGETFHPVAGPIAEAEALYVRQLRLRERLSGAGARHSDAAWVPGTRGAASECRVPVQSEFVIWDVGLGAGGNALTAIRRLNDLPAHLRIVSFDRTLDALRFAARHAEELQFPIGFEKAIEDLLEQQRSEFVGGKLRVTWEVRLGDFPRLVAAAAAGGNSVPAPHAVFFDAFSPARNPEMWTLPLFTNLFRCLAANVPCALATFSRSTLARTAMLRAGFFVGAGEPVAGKEETTIAANQLDLLARPLDARWLERARVSRSAEPLTAPVYQQAPLSAETLAALHAHPQFRTRP